MKQVRLLLAGLLIAFLAQPMFAKDTVTKMQDKFKEYVHDVTARVKEAPDANQKRKILHDSFDKMLNALDRVESMLEVSPEEAAFIEGTRQRFTDYRNELNGENGFERVADGELDAFAGYVQNDLEQAEKTITISLTSLLLIIIIVLLLA